MTEQTIPCPACQTPVAFDTAGLLMGKHFKCGNCQAEIALSDSSRSTVSSAIDRLEQLKDADQD